MNQRHDQEYPGRAEAEILDLLLDEAGSLTTDRQRYLELLWTDNPAFHQLLAAAPDVEEARQGVYAHLEQLEREMCDHQSDVHLLELVTIRDCIFAMRNLIARGNEELTETSALTILWRLARPGERELSPEVSCGFLLEVICLLRGLSGRASIYAEHEASARTAEQFLHLEGQDAALQRTEILDELAGSIQGFLARYPSGLEPAVVARRQENRRRILAALGGSEADWADHNWQMDHVLKGPELLGELLGLPAKEVAAIRRATEHRIPFGITPHYLSLMDRDRSLGLDHAVRAQVLPPPEYVEQMITGRTAGGRALDFMGELDSSPVELITRRYPMIAILKPYNTCSQICVYCQRNWEIDECLAADALAPAAVIERAVDWLRAHPGIGEVLVTGGDPLVLPDEAIAALLERLADVPSIYRIRLGTRTPVVLPQRWTAALADLIARYHEPGRREVAVVTHFEHSYEVTPEAMHAVSRIRRRGLSVYNQQVYTLENSRRFETAKLRLVLRSIGVDPYYTFNMKGKDETQHLTVPIARLLQERKEEARLLPGLDRTDEPVFNVPRLGKNYIRLWQDHRLLTILADGRRVYSLHPWEKNLALVPPYFFVDTSIYDYLQELARRGEDLREYRTIWYYF